MCVMPFPIMCLDNYKFTYQTEQPWLNKTKETDQN